MRIRACRTCYLAVDALWRRPALGPALAIALVSAAALVLLGSDGLAEIASPLYVLASIATLAAAALAWRSGGCRCPRPPHPHGCPPHVAVGPNAHT